ncbi:MAG TPA: VWA domain-containing protein [Candidatus Limnocylindrales bacterium]|nr:VWA domain-containing protein [Candidatus Limnocylindrales bacterium]
MPCRNLALKARTDRRYIRSTYRSNRFILAEIAAPHAHREGGDRSRPPVNLAFVIDRSGSMAGEKMRLAKEAVRQSIARLQADDQFSVVTYDDVVDVVVGSTRATPESRERALAQLATIDARNQTNLAEGWLRGCAQVAEHLLTDGVNRCLLLTDGLANVGMTNPDELARHAGELRARGVSTTTFGVGADFDEVLLQAMATAGGGNFYYIADGRQIADYVTSEVGEALDVVARDVRLEIVAPESAAVESLSPFPFESRGARTIVSLGSMVAEQVVQVVLRVNLPLGESSRETGIVLSVAGASAVAAGSAEPSESVAISWEYADSKTNDAQERDAEVDRAVARVFASRARQEATSLNHAGDYGRAAAALTSVAKRIRSYAGRDTEMRNLIASLDADAQQLAAPMPPAALKEMHFRSYRSAKTRDEMGRAMRRPQS